ncbi:MAG: sel1 repeat family protein [Gammaproteobacteria bacterium]|nr:sel1 repeat family protein [Gammaproteobacteria bacterium]
MYSTTAARPLMCVLVLLMVSFSLLAAEPDLQQLREQAEQGDAWAQLNLGAAYDNGMGVERDIEQALHWYQKAAEQGVAKAQFNLAHLLVSEELSSETAAGWMLKAANQGMLDAQYLMGVIYAEGIGVEVDDVKAVDWLQKAAAQGQPEAARFLKETYSLQPDSE